MRSRARRTRAAGVTRAIRAYNDGWPWMVSHAEHARGSVVTVALIDDNRLMRDGLVRLLDDVEDLRVVAAMSEGAIETLRRLRPQIVLLTLGAVRDDALRVVAEIRERCPESRLIVMNLPGAGARSVASVAAGVSAFVSRDATLDVLAATIRTVAGAGHARVGVHESGRRPPVVVRMTPRERDVVALIADGMSNQQIAEQLAIASDTVKSHVRNVMKKLMVHTRLQIAAYAHRDVRVDD
jgi:two-component system nitrate/nitrite response regulator NarL